MRIYYDTEFTSLDGNIDWDMISAGFVAEDGREWYAEIEDFNLAECSQFVVDTVLPLLGQHPAERIPGKQFGARFGQWLATFQEDIELISDARCDWWLIYSMADQALQQLPYRVQNRTWQPIDDVQIQSALQEGEARFWTENPGRQHHALFDARRLRTLADLQQQIILA